MFSITKGFKIEEKFNDKQKNEEIIINAISIKRSKDLLLLVDLSIKSINGLDAKDLILIFIIIYQ